ncbi:MAG: hypothetical protein ISR45_08155 [Rhodospirillales bacterium]|nr:hypothetical protein [Rhodospirillales bacterium]
MGQRLSQIEWSDRDKLGFTDLDIEHRGLVEIINRVIRAINEDDQVQYRLHANNFAQALILHFANEETFLHEIRYSHLDKHRAHHQSLLEGALAFNRLSHSMEDLDTLGGYLEEIKTALLEDIRGGDHYFLKFLETEGADKTVKARLLG